VKSCVKILCEELIDIFQTVLIMENPQRKRLWIRKWLARRNTHGASNTLLKELATEDIEEYKHCMRMSPACFENLLKKISSIIQRVDTTMRSAIPAKVKLEITLSYLATGNSFRNLQQQFRVSRPAISNFIPEVCDAIYDALKEFIQVRTLYHLFTQNLNQ
jgi:hypothetical protein